MTNDEKIQLIGQKILVLSNNLDKYKQELAFLQNQLNELKTEKTVSQTTDAIVNDVKSVIEEVKLQETRAETLTKSVKKEAVTPDPGTKYAYEDEPGKSFTAGLNFEEKIGARWFSIIGIITLVLGLAIGVKYAIDKELINETTRLVLGYLSGTLILGLALLYKKKYEVFSAVLLSGAMSVMYYTTYVGYSHYHFYQAPAAFIIMAVFTGFTVLAAHVYNYEIIALIGLVGGYAIPPLLSTGSGEIQYMFGFMLILNLGVLVLSFKKYWKFVNHVAYALSWLIFSAWMDSSYNAENYFGRAMFFSTAFYLIFYFSFISYKIYRNKPFSVWDIILVLSNSLIYFGIGFNAMTDTYYEQFRGLFCLVNAVIHLGFALLCRKKEIEDKTIFHFIIAMVVSFVTMAIPIQLDGNYVTLIWLCEMIVLTRMAKKTGVNTYRNLSHIMSALAFFSLIHDWTSYTYFSNNTDTTLALQPLLNRYFLTDILGTVAYGIVWQMNRTGAVKKTILNRVAGVSVIVIGLIVAYFTFGNEIMLYFDVQYKLSEFKHIGEYGDRWTDHDNSWYSYNGLWMINYTIVFVSLLGASAIYKFRKVEFMRICWILTLIVTFIALSAGLIIIDNLKMAAVYDFKYSHISTWNYNARYAFIPFVGLLLAMIYVYRKNKLLPELKTANTWILHGLVLLLLSNELKHIITMLHLNEYGHYQKVATNMGYTVLWGVYSMVLIAYGILRKHKTMRIIAITLFGITILKLASDAMNMTMGYRLVVFITIGVILLLVSFMYQKFKPLLMDESNYENSNSINEISE